MKTFKQYLEEDLSRRNFLKRTGTAAAIASTGIGLSSCAADEDITYYLAANANPMFKKALKESANEWGRTIGLYIGPDTGLMYATIVITEMTPNTDSTNLGIAYFSEQEFRLSIDKPPFIFKNSLHKGGIKISPKILRSEKIYDERTLQDITYKRVKTVILHELGHIFLRMSTNDHTPPPSLMTAKHEDSTGKIDGWSKSRVRKLIKKGYYARFGLT